PGGSTSRSLIKNISYSLLLFDDELPDTTGAELKRFASSSAYCKKPPVVIFKKSDEFSLLVQTIIELLD
ncbi:MAG: hypothetical protein WBP93_02105, partial [Pyrinomonadaceae bacterium]